jgi:hypothetical protein
MAVSNPPTRAGDNIMEITFTSLPSPVRAALYASWVYKQAPLLGSTPAIDIAHGDGYGAILAAIDTDPFIEYLQLKELLLALDMRFVD